MRLYSVGRYGARHWAVYDTEDELVCVTVYRKGAYEVAHRLAGAEGTLSRLGLFPDQTPIVAVDRDRDPKYLSDRNYKTDIPNNKKITATKKGQYQYG